jgi:hypothetical protein
MHVASITARPEEGNDQTGQMDDPYLSPWAAYVDSIDF